MRYQQYLRHTHAMILLSDREPVSTVSQRLGHKSEVITLTIYSHVLPGDGKRAAARFAELVGEA
jgi:integrase